jgi:hypothetical protein
MLTKLGFCDGVRESRNSSVLPLALTLSTFHVDVDEDFLSGM